MNLNFPNWYRIPQVKFQIRKYTYKRETMFMKAKHAEHSGQSTRMLRIHNVQHLDLWMNQLYLFKHKREYNMYYSLAQYTNGIPFGTTKLAERDFGDWKDNHWKFMSGYDFLLDIDAGNHKEMHFAYHSALIIKQLFNKLEVPYHLRFSGMGFHFVIPYHYFYTLKHSFNPEDESNIYLLFNDIAIELNKKYSEMIDTTIYDSRRVTKIPYSLSLYENKDYVCIPFNDNFDFMNFYLHEMLPDNQYSKVLLSDNEHLYNINGNIFKLLKELDI